MSNDGNGDYLKASSVYLDMEKESFATPPSPWYESKTGVTTSAVELTFDFQH